MSGKRPRDDDGKIRPWRPAGWEPVTDREADDVRAHRVARAKGMGIHPDDTRTASQRGLDRANLGHLGKQAFPVSAARPEKGPKPKPHLMTDGQLLALVKKLERAAKYDWDTNARPEQKEPPDYNTWILNAGRGFGKTRTGAETVRDWVEKQGLRRIAVIAKGSRELRNVCFEGVSGLLAVFPPEMIKAYRKGLGDTYLELTNGAIIIGYSAEAPDAIRGQSFDAIWGDEFAAWPKHLAKDMFDQSWFCLREQENPRIILTTTPKRVAHLMDLLEEAKDGKRKIVVTKGKTRDNPVLKAQALEELEARYAGTHLGRQELDGELLGDVEGALWIPDMVEAARWEEREDDKGEPIPLPKFRKVIIGVDPSGSETGDATGIVAIGYTADKRIFVLGCYSTKGLPAVRYSSVCAAAEKHKGQGLRTEILVEYNFGGDNAMFAIEQQWKHMRAEGYVNGPCPMVKKSTLRGDKAAKSSPVAALYEQQFNRGVERIWHLEPSASNGIHKLENEMLSWAVTDKASPNSLDAATIAVRRAMQELGWEGGLGRPGPGRRIDPDGWRPF